jgi:hypothetical protein
VVGDGRAHVRRYYFCPDWNAGGRCAVSRSTSSRQPPRHRRFCPDDRDDERRALERAAAEAGRTDVATGLADHEDDRYHGSSGYLLQVQCCYH